MTEEATKTSIIMPFFAMLGYDVFNPNEFCPEYTADVGIKKGEKVVVLITGNGLKDIDSAISTVEMPQPVAPDSKTIEEHVKKITA